MNISYQDLNGRICIDGLAIATQSLARLHAMLEREAQQLVKEMYTQLCVMKSNILQLEATDRDDHRI